MLEDVLPEELMPEVRRIALEEAQQAADEWMRSRGPYRIGHREGREEGLLRGRRDALTWILEARGLTPSSAEQTRIDDCAEIRTLERWCARAKTATRVAELFDEFE